MKSDLPSRFLHTHPGLEKALMLPEDHVIVDRKDYDIIMRMIQLKEFDITTPIVGTIENYRTIQIEVPEPNKTDLTFEEEHFGPTIFKGSYLKTIDKSWQKFKKNYLKRKKNAKT